jgi:hypothetical protein
MEHSETKNKCMVSEPKKIKLFPILLSAQGRATTVTVFFFESMKKKLGFEVGHSEDATSSRFSRFQHNIQYD